MLFMLTPEIKTNLILKEIGIKRYSLRPKIPNSQNKSLHYYQKGLILALLDKPFNNFIKEHQDFLKAIIKSTKLDHGEEIFKTVSFSSIKELNEKILTFSNIKLIFIFDKFPYNLKFDTKLIKALPIEQIKNSKELKKDLWTNIKRNLNL